MSKRTANRFYCHVNLVKKRLQHKRLAFEAAFSTELVLEAFRRCSVTFRERVYTPRITLWALLGHVLSGDGSCRESTDRNGARRFLKIAQARCVPDGGVASRLSPAGV